MKNLFLLIFYFLAVVQLANSQTIISGCSNLFELDTRELNISNTSSPFELDTRLCEVIRVQSSPFVLNTLNTIQAEVKGIITNTAGEPLSGVVVTALNYNSLPSGPDGTYQLFLPYGYGYQLEFTVPLYQPKAIQNIHLTQQQPTVELDVQLASVGNYDNYRVVPIDNIPNAQVLEVPEGGIGYVWFRLEGQTTEATWVAVPESEITVIDEQGNEIFSHNGSRIRTNYLNYKYLHTLLFTEKDGVFGIPIHAGSIQNGTVGSVEQFTVTKANGQLIQPSNQQTVIAKVVPLSYEQSWGFRVYGKAGVGAGTVATAGIAKGNAFAGGGSGVAVALQLQGNSIYPGWQKFKVNRKDDLFIGTEISIGTPTLLATNFEANAGLKMSFPYQKEFEFDLDSIDSVVSMFAFYLLYEPSILLAGSSIPGGQISVSVLSWLVEYLISQSATSGEGYSKIADETGLDLEGNLNFNAGIGLGTTHGLGLTAGPSLGSKAHVGGTLRYEKSGLVKNSLYAGGGYDASLKLGLKHLNGINAKLRFFYPVALRIPNLFNLPNKYDIEFSIESHYMNSNWQGTKLSSSIESNHQSLNLYNLSGQLQKYSSWVSFNQPEIREIFVNNGGGLANVMNIGQSTTNFSVSDNSFNQGYSGLLGKVYDSQIAQSTMEITYGLDATSKTEIEVDLTLQIPIPVFPAIDLVIGGGFSYFNEFNYQLSKGYWNEGIPYLQSEIYQPPISSITFNDFLEQLWEKILPNSQDLAALIFERLLNSRYLSWLSKSGEVQMIALNESGSSIVIRPNSLPVGIDSVLCRQWDWSEEATSRLRSDEKIQSYNKYAKALRKIREEAVGMRYGIGGFYRFEPLWESFGDSTYLTIAYSDDEVAGYDINGLGLYWEDSLGVWHPLESFLEPDSSRVSAWINHFTTYTLAPRMPQGNYGLFPSPDSLPADGVSTAMITSSLLYNNDSTQLADGALFTVEINRGNILTDDIDQEIAGIQVAVQDGLIQFQVQVDSIAHPIELNARSTEGFARCVGILILYDTISPLPPTNLVAIGNEKSVLLEWEEVNVADLAGYKIYYDTDTLPPFNGIHTVYGQSSPIILGTTNMRNIVGLFNDTTYYFAVSAYDISGNESPLSAFVSATPGIQIITPPDWEPEPDLPFAMQLIAKLQLPERSYSDNPADIIGAFVGNECRGVASPQNEYYNLQIESDIPSGDTIRFRAFLASSGEIVELNESLIFAENTVTGSIDEPFIFTLKNQAAVLVGRLLYYNSNETAILTNTEHSTFNLQLYQDGIAVGDVKSIGEQNTFVLDALQSNSPYQLRLWEETNSGLLQDAWTYINWGGVSAVDALIINKMAVNTPDLISLPWIKSPATGDLSPFSINIGDVNNSSTITALDALVSLYRIVGVGGMEVFPGGKSNFMFAASLMQSDTSKTYPNAPEILFSQNGIYQGDQTAANVYNETVLPDLSAGINYFNIYGIATGDVNANYLPQSLKNLNASLLTDRSINHELMELVPVSIRTMSALNLGAMDLYLKFDNQTMEVVNIPDYDVQLIDNKNGIIKIAWYDIDGKNYKNGEQIAQLNVRPIKPVNQDKQLFELLAGTEFADPQGNIFEDVVLLTDQILVKENAATPAKNILKHLASPNPFTQQVAIDYYISSSGKIAIRLMDAYGSILKETVKSDKQEGAHRIIINKDELSLSTGIYFYEIEFEQHGTLEKVIGKIVLVK